MLQRLSAEYTGFAAFLPAEMSEEAVRNRMLIFVNGQVARLRDALSDRDVVEAITQSREVNTFIPALAYLYARNPTEVPVRHEERAAGESKYSLYKLIRLNFDLVTGFSVAPLQMFSFVGIVVSLLSALFVIYLVYRRLAVGPEAEGVFTLFAIIFLLIGIMLFGIGLLGEYVGRIYQQVRQRPRYIVQAVLEQAS